MELTPHVRAFSELIGTPVFDEAERSLGRVFEARAHLSADGSIVFDELLVGRRALLRRLRGQRREEAGIPWEDVVEIGDDRIVVSRSAH